MASASPPPQLRHRSPTAAFPEAPKESAVTRLLITPLTFISFLLSLALIDSRNSSFRSHIHDSSRPPPPDTVFGRAKNTIHGWAYRPQPYAYIKSPAALRREKSGEVVKEGQWKAEPWHWHTKQRKMMKMEVVDAFEMRKMVVVAIVVALVGLAVGGIWLISYCGRLILRHFWDEAL